MKPHSSTLSDTRNPVKATCACELLTITPARATSRREVTGNNNKAKQTRLKRDQDARITEEAGCVGLTSRHAVGNFKSTGAGRHPRTKTTLGRQRDVLQPLRLHAPQKKLLTGALASHKRQSSRSPDPSSAAANRQVLAPPVICRNPSVCRSCSCSSWRPYRHPSPAQRLVSETRPPASLRM
jgi:hypothetical protein